MTTMGMDSKLLVEGLVLAQQGQTSGPNNSLTLTLMQFFPLFLLLVVMYVVLIRPQHIRAKKHAELIKSLRPRDKVLTSSGIVGEIISIKEHTVTIRSGESKFEIIKSSVTDLLEREGEPVPTQERK